MTIFNEYDLVHEYIHNKINILISQLNEYVYFSAILLSAMPYLLVGFPFVKETVFLNATRFFES